MGINDKEEARVSKLGYLRSQNIRTNKRRILLKKYHEESKKFFVVPISFHLYFPWLLGEIWVKGRKIVEEIQGNSEKKHYLNTKISFEKN